MIKSEIVFRQRLKDTEQNTEQNIYTIIIYKIINDEFINIFIEYSPAMARQSVMVSMYLENI